MFTMRSWLVSGVGLGCWMFRCLVVVAEVFVLCFMPWPSYLTSHIHVIMSHVVVSAVQSLSRTRFVETVELVILKYFSDIMMLSTS